jgi:CheY-like chemotaxis protein
MASAAEPELCAPSIGEPDDSRQLDLEPAIPRTESVAIEPSLQPLRASAGQVILAVDDNAEVRGSVVFQLRALGYDVREADNAHAALAILDGGERIDLLFTDVVMPGGLNGKELATRARLKRPDLKVLFTSGFMGTAMSNGAALEDCDVLLSKPYRRHDLVKAVRDMLGAEAA